LLLALLVPNQPTNQPINKSINLLTSGNVAHAEKNNTHTEKNSKSMQKVKKENEKHKGTHLNYKKMTYLYTKHKTQKILSTRNIWYTKNTDHLTN